METLDANHNHSSLQSETRISPTYLQNSTSNPKISDSINNNIQPPETLPSKNLMETLDANHNHSSLEEGAAVNDGSGTNGTRKRKSRCADDVPNPVIQLPDFMKDHTAGMVLNPKIQALKNRLVEIGRQFQSGLHLDDRPEGARSPSPEPVYDNTGIRVNTREYRARERLNKERQEIISQILKNNPSFKPPVDYMPPKVSKKLFIPVKEYPGYNFIGLIIGPRGNTQKRMEKETGAMISVQGRGSVKEGKLQRKRNLKYDLSEYEDLHVFVEADTQEAVDAAASMVQKLLQPVDEGVNEHKRQQLKELAAYNGTIRDVEFCRLCGEPGHRKSACPSRNSTFKSDVLCKICGDGGHPTTDCTVKGSAGKKMDDEYQNFMAELGETVPEFSDVNQANTAIACMNGHQLEGRSMAVRVAKRPQPVVPSGPPALVPGSYPTQPPVVGGAHLAPYSGNPVPWGPPPPPTYPPYPPPPPGSTMYPQVMSQSFPPYGILYPLAVPTVSSAATSLTVSSGEMQQSVQPAYSMPSFAYAPYYGVPSTANMPQSTIDHSQIVANVPWAPRPYIPPSTISARDKLI